jgi:hypothetical protein
MTKEFLKINKKRTVNQDVFQSSQYVQLRINYHFASKIRLLFCNVI